MTDTGVTASPADASLPGLADPHDPADGPAPRTLPRAFGSLSGAVAAGALGGLLLDLAFPDPGWWPLAPVGVAVMALAVRGRSATVGALVGMAAGLALFVPLLSWSGIYLGWLPWVALATLQALFVAVLGALLPAAWRVPGGRAGTVAAVACLWVAQEAARGRVPFGGFPWGRLAFSQADAPAVTFASLGGAPLVSAVVAATGGLLAVAAASAVDAVRARAATRERGGREAVTAGWLVVAAAAAASGLLVPLPAGGDGPQVAVAAVQGNVPEPGLDFNARRRAVLDNHATATTELARRVRAGAPAPDIVVWPENSSDIDPLRNPDAREVIQSAVDAVGVPTLVGTVLVGPAGRPLNAAIVWGPSGSPAAGPGQRYVKRHPAPFAEYIPYRSFFRRISTQVDLVPRDFVAGDRVGVLDMGPARIGDVICFEVAYDSLVRDTVRAGADLIVVQTNNATFGYSDESIQQLAMSRVRAIESGRAVVHVSTVGVSGLIGPDGTLLERSSLFRQDVLQAHLPLRTALTPATRVGAIPEVLLTLMAPLLLAGARLRNPGRRRRDARTGAA